MCNVRRSAVKYHNVSIVEVILPVWPYLALPTDIPHIELDAVRDDTLDVEALRGRYVRNVFAGERLQQRRFAGIVKTWSMISTLRFFFEKVRSPSSNIRSSLLGALLNFFSSDSKPCKRSHVHSA